MPPSTLRHPRPGGDRVVRVAVSIGSVAAVLIVGLPPGAEGLPGYSYAGGASRSAVGAVAATVTAFDLAHVRAGHVAAWVGVGGPGQGLAGDDEWIQVGLNGFAEASTGTIYLEVKRGSFYRYAALLPGVGLGEPHRIAVVESASRPGWWRAFVDGAPASPLLLLPGSHGKWQAQIVAENWTAGSPACNAFAFGFADITVRYTFSRTLTGLTQPLTFAQGGISLSRSGTSFTTRRRC